MNFVSSKNEVLTDVELYRKCQQIGAACRKYRNQFLGMLPEVMRRSLYLKHGMSSIYEFAAKLACISRETVNEVLRIHQHLEAAPLLQEKLVSGEIGYTKLRAIATIVKPETQQLWLEKVESMSKPTLEVYVREVKRQSKNGQHRWAESGDEKGELVGMGQKVVDAPGVSDQMSGLPGKEYDFVPFSVKVKPQTLAKMRVMKDRLEKKLKKPMNWDEAFREMLKILDEGKPKQRLVHAAKHIVPTSAGSAGTRAILPLEQKPAKPASTRAIRKRVANPAGEQKPAESANRYIPAAIRHEVEDKNSGICHFPVCTKPGKIFHHINRFALDPTHQSKTIVYLCKPHEQIAHQSLIDGESEASENWKILMNPEITDIQSAARYCIDCLVQKYRFRSKPRY